MGRIFGIIAGFIGVLAIVWIGSLAYDRFNPSALRSREIDRAFEAADGDRLLEFAARQDWSEQTRQFVILQFVNIANMHPDRLGAYERRLAALRDAATSEVDVSNYRYGLTILNDEHIRNAADDLAARVSELVSAKPQDDLPFAQPESVDLLLNLRRPPNLTTSSEQRTAFEPYWLGPSDTIRGIVGLEGLTRTEIDARTAASTRLGVVVHSSRVVGRYQGCDPDFQVAKFRSTDAIQYLAELYVIELERAHVSAAMQLEGEPPPQMIAAREGSSNCASSGARPDVNPYFVVGSTNSGR